MTLTRRLRGEDGSSLIELVAAFGIFLLLLLAVMQLFDAAARSERSGQARHESLLEVREAMTRISKDLRQATSISATSTNDRIEMETLIAGESHQVVFDVVDGEVRRTIDGGQPVPLVDGVSTAEPFCFDPPDCLATSPSAPTMVRVSIDAEPEVFSGGPITLSSDVKLRNS